MEKKERINLSTVKLYLWPVWINYNLQQPNLTKEQYPAGGIAKYITHLSWTKLYIDVVSPGSERVYSKVLEFDIVTNHLFPYYLPLIDMLSDK